MTMAEARRALRSHRPLTWKNLCSVEEIWAAASYEADPLRHITLTDMGFLCDILLAAEIPLISEVMRLEEVIQNMEFEHMPLEDVKELVRIVLKEARRVINENQDRLRPRRP